MSAPAANKPGVRAPATTVPLSPPVTSAYLNTDSELLDSSLDGQLEVDFSKLKLSTEAVDPSTAVDESSPASEESTEKQLELGVPRNYAVVCDVLDTFEINGRMVRHLRGLHPRALTAPQLALRSTSSSSTGCLIRLMHGSF